MVVCQPGGARARRAPSQHRGKRRPLLYQMLRRWVAGVSVGRHSVTAGDNFSTDTDAGPDDRRRIGVI